MVLDRKCQSNADLGTTSPDVVISLAMSNFSRVTERPEGVMAKIGHVAMCSCVVMTFFGDVVSLPASLNDIYQVILDCQYFKRLMNAEY